MKVSGILSIVSVIAIFAAFSPNVNAKVTVTLPNMDTPDCPSHCAQLVADCKDGEECKAKLTSHQDAHGNDCAKCQIQILAD